MVNNNIITDKQLLSLYGLFADVLEGGSIAKFNNRYETLMEIALRNPNGNVLIVEEMKHIKQLAEDASKKIAETEKQKQ